LVTRLPESGKGARFSTTRRQGGFTFLVVLAIIAIMGIGLMAVNEVWATAKQREKEQELLFIGHQFREAIRQYSQNNPAGKQIQIYPKALEELLLDPRYPNVRRYLRKMYTDPMTGKDEWGVMKYPGGGIYGVYSLSEEEPIKRDNFDLEDGAFKDASRYSAWAFNYKSQLAASSPAITNSMKTTTPVMR
jgi:type II secretory pathway pseudopilin PulG